MWSQNGMIQAVPRVMPLNCCVVKSLSPMHGEARLDSFDRGMLQRRRHAHRRVAAGRFGAVHANWQRWCRQQCRWKPAWQAVSEQKVKNCM